MDPVADHPLMQLSEELVTSTRKSAGLDAKQIHEIMDAILEWWKKEEHLVDALPYLGRDILERFVIIAKGSIEQTKQLIDRVFTTRVLAYDFLKGGDEMVLNELSNIMDNVFAVNLPKCHPKDHTRYFLIKLMNPDFEDINFLDLGMMGCFVVEMRLHYDYLFLDRLIIDFKNIKPSFITKFNPIVVKKLDIMFFQTYKNKVKGLHIVNAPPFFNKVLIIIKQILSEKIAKRIFVHASYEDMYKEIPKECLPSDYGGDLMSCSELAEEWKQFFKTETAKNILKRGSRLLCDESKRTCPRLTDEYLGMAGSFKQLAID